MKKILILCSGIFVVLMFISGCGRSGIDHYAYELATLHCEIKKVNNEMRITKISSPEFLEIKEQLEDLRRKQHVLSEEALTTIASTDDLEKFNTLFNQYVKDCEE